MTTRISAIVIIILGALAAIALPLMILKVTNPFLILYQIASVLYVASIFAMALLYEPVEANPDYSPSVSILIPVYNEPWNVLEKCILSAQNTHYKGAKEVIVVNDGSANGIDEKLHSLANVKVISFKRNKGNKHARAEAIRNASGEILVFIDSDTLLKHNAIQNIVAPFQDSDTGAVCGHLDVENAGRNLLTKLQVGWYYTSFRVYRGAEDNLNLVSCCAGAFSAYRKKFITQDMMNEWLNGRFLGLYVTAGVDRALTNLFLRKYKVKYQFTAQARTLVPVTWRSFIKQQIRWTKSWIRENTFGATFLYKRGFGSLFFYTSTFIRLISQVIVTKSLVFDQILFNFDLTIFQLPLLSITYFSGLALVGFLYALFARHDVSFWKYRIVFPIVYSIISSPIFLYSILAIRNPTWGTRLDNLVAHNPTNSKMKIKKVASASPSAQAPLFYDGLNPLNSSFYRRHPM